MSMDNAGPKPWHSALWVVVLTLLLTGILVLLVHPRVFNTNTYIDTNSGDLRVETTVFGLPVRNTIKETRFSREVRRLGIAVPQDRAWRLAMEEEGLLMGTHVHSRDWLVVDRCELLVQIFTHGKVPDEERLVILQKILASFKDSRLAEREVTDQFEALESRVYREVK